jgi:D-tyrosyl-tRNA(Tyr) deacylase
VKLVIQRVSRASVTVDGTMVSNINRGLLVLVGISESDTEEFVPWLAQKLVNLRIFEDENGKMNLSLLDIRGECLLVSQFTLYAECSRGRRPDFLKAAHPSKAEPLYDRFCEEVGFYGVKTAKGVFGADMKVELLNDGPVTIILEKASK